ncbi:MAG: CDP-alcohol phosphatidyltransferase family protein [Deltaproteobacteria bacterium]|nr:CDP-alcohol phosphatidyltransferase family protein [Deltaproteobacteria bacterium]MBW1875385.1 CDP-alcohol phosphatidyltransferase family protein [Deltaproteobacteria bacterium]MBW2211331.1 CDP-alcohol phosphatidyltransferase family protein [Deltaproteobacteria bacterium]MBW2214986.1 CDP-alcohol phosphatidyltransferase family protein [Deltaproteobacteria bacterium]MBW2380267.1 CDP-alcohol phosphatidyltransferase family protein [Deltaproteobacteria bacterium]
MKLKYIPNMICIARIILVAPIVWSLLEERYGLALSLIVIAGLSDALDGYLARRFDWRTRLGGLLDPAADKFLMFAAFVTLAWIGLVPVWFSAIVVGRDIIIISGTIFYHLTVAPIHGEPTGASKLNTVFQILFVLLTISHAWLGQPPMLALQLLGAAILATIGISTVQYVTTGFSRARKAKRPD